MSGRGSVKQRFFQGFRDGLPIGLGYFAVSFSLGIVAKNSGLTAAEGLFASLTTIASAGQYALFVLIGAQATYAEIAVMTLVTNIRYLLMSFSLSQRFRPEEPVRHRIGVGAFITDELFGINISHPGYVDPLYSYAAILAAVPLWGLGTALGVAAGNILPEWIVGALSVAIYGMFLAIIIPPASSDRVIAGIVIAGFALSFLFSRARPFSGISEGTRTIILTVVIASAAAALFPKRVEEEAES